MFVSLLSNSFPTTQSHNLLMGFLLCFSHLPKNPSACSYLKTKFSFLFFLSLFILRIHLLKLGTVKEGLTTEAATGESLGQASLAH